MEEENEKGGMVILYTGSGEGKTITSLGRALRAVGHRYKVVMVQFMKGREFIGEYKIQERLSPEFEMYQFGRERFIDLQNPDPVDIELAHKGLEFAKEALRGKPRLLILDEINLATAIGLLKVEEVLELLGNIPKETTVILTGRHSPPELIDRADSVTVMTEVKHHFSKGVPAKKGIEY